MSSPSIAITHIAGDRRRKLKNPYRQQGSGDDKNREDRIYKSLVAFRRCGSDSGSRRRRGSSLPLFASGENVPGVERSYFCVLHLCHHRACVESELKKKVNFFYPVARTSFSLSQPMCGITLGEKSQFFYRAGSASFLLLPSVSLIVSLCRSLSPMSLSLCLSLLLPLSDVTSLSLSLPLSFSPVSLFLSLTVSLTPCSLGKASIPMQGQ